MPFQGHAICNAPATFERLMDRVLQGLRWTRWLVYLDDIISFGSTFSDALDNLTLIFERLRSYGPQLKSTKCHLFQTSVPFLGHIVGRRGLECDPVKIEDIRSWLFQIALKVFANSWVLSAIIYGLYQMWWRWQGRMSHLFGIRSVRQLFTPCVIHLYMHLFWLFRQRPANTSWTLTPVTLGWAVSWVRYRVMWSVWLLIVVVLFDPRSDGIAPLNERCWLLWLCVSSSGCIYVALSSLSVQITSPCCGCIFSRIRRVWWPGGGMLCNSSSFP